MKPSRLDTLLNVLSILILLAVTVCIIVIWPTLPERIPTHYDFAGNIDGYGGKGAVLIMPVVMWILYIALTLVERLPPDSWNTGVKVTPANRDRVYGVLRHLLSTMKLLFIGLNAFLTLQQLRLRPVTVWFTLLEIALFTGNIIFWIVRLSKSK